MKLRRLEDMVGGWIVGDFEPTCLRTPACEVACKHYPAGAHEDTHVHRIATEITLIASGRARMNGRELAAIDPTITVVVKMPSVAGDKYPVGAGAGLAGVSS